MKKVLLLSFLMSLVMFGFSACGDDDDDVPDGGARVEVTVKDEDGDKQEGVRVYMYKDTPITDETKKEDAYRYVDTDKDGVAVFTLRFGDLDILEKETRLYFAVFYTYGGEELIESTTAVTVERDDNKNIDLKIRF